MPTTQEQLNAAVDQQFFQEHPDAPRRLDPHEPSHQQYVTQWNHIRDRTANAWADHYLKEFYPDSPGHLEPNNPAHHQYIEYWNDIHQQILTGQPGRWSWSSPPQHQAQDAQHGAQGAEHGAQGAQHTVGEPHPGLGEQHQAPAGQHAAQGAQHAAEGEHHAAQGTQHGAQGEHHGAQAPTAAAAPAPHASAAPQPATVPAEPETAQSSGWIYLDLRVNTKGVDGVNDLRGYEVWAQPIGADSWYQTTDPTSAGRMDAYFRDVLARPDAGILLHYRATESVFIPELEAQISCDSAQWVNDRNFIDVQLCQQMNVVTVEAATPDEAIHEACGSYPASGYIDEQQRNSTDHPAGERRKFEVWVGLPTVTA